jgi:polyhydroxybutyrate depolymerase
VNHRPIPAPSVIVSNGIEREFYVYAPKNSENEHLPVVFVLHGGGGPIGTAELLMERTTWIDKAESEGFLAVFPQGTIEDPGKPIDLSDAGPGRNIRSWSDGSEITPASKQGIDDTSFIENLLDDLLSKYKIDEKRIYVTGFSNGATMTYALGVQLAHRLAAIAPVAGLLYIHAESLSSPVSLISILGREDRPPPREFNFVGSVYAATYVTNPVAVWRNYLDCPGNPEKSLNTEGVNISEYGPCKAGSNVSSYIIDGIGHVYPGSESFFKEGTLQVNGVSAVDISWGFFKKHPKVDE